MRISERVYCSRFPVESTAFTSVAKRDPGRPQGDGYRCSDEARDRNRYFRGGGAAVFYQSALHRSLELAAKRRRSDRAEFFAKRISLRLSASRLGRQRAGLCRNGISNFALRCGGLLQNCGCARMDRTNSGGHFVCGFAAIFLFARSRDLWKHGSGLGDFLLLFCATKYFRRSFVHAGCPVA